MKKQKISLVLEGGGMRGAYTAGALTWLLDNNIEFDCVYGISVGAVHLCNFLLKDRENLHLFTTQYITDKNAIGIRAFLRSFRIVDYDYLFDVLMKNVGFDIDKLHKTKRKGKVGLYDLDKGFTEFYETKNITLNELKASCTLPILGKVVCENNRYIFDGGISEMIPIKEAIKDKCDKHLIITTKPYDYVRKKAKGIVVGLMRLVYPKWQSVADDYKIRHLNYVDQIGIIQRLEKENKALYCYPTQKSNVTRLGGSRQELESLFELGYNDMEKRKKQIFDLLEKDV